VSIVSSVIGPFTSSLSLRNNRLSLKRDHVPQLLFIKELTSSNSTDNIAD